MQTNGTADEEAQMSIMREHLLNAGLHVEGELLFFLHRRIFPIQILRQATVRLNDYSSYNRICCVCVTATV